jgi:23S rRNA (pseudouridine1915-N3)-methyltransferase
MNIKLIVIGKTMKGFVLDGINEYIDRLKHYTNFSIEVIGDVKNAKSLSATQLKEKEEESILSFLNKNQFTSDNATTIVLLDEKGQEMKSTEFATYLQKQMNMGTKNLLFLVGGAYGFSDNLKQMYKNKISISKMTFSHQMIRLLFTEQVYRAFTIINNFPYHNE